jgi:crotonobetainyl-CoA:carnitine CoA-transferase CaiB-like acyl-CoA transferase
VLDVATGYQIAAAVVRGLTRRLKTGAGSVTHMSLARTQGNRIWNSSSGVE